LRFPPVDILLGLALTAVAVLRPAWQRIKSLGARGWVTIQGRVGSATVRAQHGYIPYYLVSVTYTYVPNGEYYSGCYERTFLKKNSAETFASNVKGRMVLVRYQPQQPERSALLEQDQIEWTT